MLRSLRLATVSRTRLHTLWSKSGKGLEHIEPREKSLVQAHLRCMHHVKPSQFVHSCSIENETTGSPVETLERRETAHPQTRQNPGKESTTPKTTSLNLRKRKHKGLHKPQSSDQQQKKKKKEKQPAQLRHIYTLAVNRRLERTLRKSASIYSEISSHLTNYLNRPAVTKPQTQEEEQESTFLAPFTTWTTLLERFSEELVVTQRRYTELCAAQILLSTVQDLNLPDEDDNNKATEILHFWNRSRKDVSWADAREKLLSHIEDVRHSQSLNAKSEINLNRALAHVYLADVLLSEFRIRMLFRSTREVVQRLDAIDTRLWLAAHLDESREYVDQLAHEVEVAGMAHDLAGYAELAGREKSMRIDESGRSRRGRRSF
ncbi:hypothetical protein F5Y17DRAFT_453333 [Xylariaceae sp. FL0594]|nr:hypothetical protein F5Y17DRAFT_453333 [Xylariaceae sp. FL0594]